LPHLILHALYFLLAEESVRLRQAADSIMDRNETVTELQVEALRDDVQGELVDPCNQALPPCIVMERGESLQEWANRAEPDLFMSLAVCAHLCFFMVELDVGETELISVGTSSHSCRVPYVKLRVIESK
jgi:hypothetical protein